jgi:hypothetical protein
MSDAEAQQFAEAVRRGGILLSARVDEGTLDRAVEIMERNGAIDVAEKVKEWRSNELAREREGLAAPPRARGARCVYVYRVTERRRIA